MNGPDPAAQDRPTPEQLVAVEATAGEFAPRPAEEVLGARHAPTAPDSSDPQERSASAVPPDGPAAALPNGPESELGSGDAALLAAEARASRTKDLNIIDVGPLPVPADTANLRKGPELNAACLALLPLVGVWRGEGLFGNEPGVQTPQFGQQIVFAHDGRDFLRYESITWKLGPDGAVTGPAARETGFWRPQPDGSIELLVAHAEGRIEVFYGQARTATSWAMSTDGVWRSSGPPVVGATRLYGVTVDGRLAYVEERAHSDAPLAPYASAALDRVAG